MALHTTGLVSRHNLRHPDEKAPVRPVYEHVLKFNPNHGPDGRFTSSGGGRQGGTAGTPTTGAFGQSLRKTVQRSLSNHPIGTQYYGDKTLIPTGQKESTAHISSETKHHPVGTIYGSDGQTLIPHKGGYIDKDTGQIYQRESQGIDDGRLRARQAYESEVKDAWKYVMGKVASKTLPGSMDKSGTPTRRSSFD